MIDGSSRMPRSDFRAHLSAAVAGGLFGASAVAVRVVVQEIPPISLALLRFGQGALWLVAILAVFSPGLLRVKRSDLPLLALLGVILFALSPVAFNVGLRWTEASRAAVMLATLPLWSSWLASRLARERLSGRQFGGLVLSVVGVALAVFDPGRALHSDGLMLLGDGLMLLSAISGAVYGVLAQPALKLYEPVTVTAYAMLLGGLALTPIAFAEGVGSAVGRLDGRLLALLVFLGLFCGALAFLLWTTALSRLTPTHVAVYVNFNPIVAALLGVLLLSERRSLVFVLGFITTIAGVLLANWPVQQSQRR